MEGVDLKEFWKGKRVLVTGHTGFKGAWLCEMLLAWGASVFGLALKPEGEPNLFDQLKLSERINHSICDVTDIGSVTTRVFEANPDIIFHLAAQSLVRRSYKQPLETWRTNVMGTANILDSLLIFKKSCSVIIVTTDQVYDNNCEKKTYVEIDRLGGRDPYSASKAATELVVESWRKSFYGNKEVRIATARAGNVIGGGDWAEDRLLPDLARAFSSGQTLTVRNRNSVRPWQHVIDPLVGYITLAEQLSSDRAPKLEKAFNFGPSPTNATSVSEVIKEALKYWSGPVEESHKDNAFHESSHLAICSGSAKKLLGWQPRWNISESVKETIVWYREVANGANPTDLTKAQIEKYWRAT